ncbi:MAG: hypothetical protein IPL53_15415 [Ignavibacteria bacterium]|nr:hypothetical protein [Ignavibacteria bacterium]
MRSQRINNRRSSVIITGCASQFNKPSADRHQRSLDIEKGDIIRLVLMHTPESEAANRLLIVIHHLAVDGVSWRILLEDLELLVSGLKEGGITELGQKSSSYRQWYNALENYGKSESLISQKAYWESSIANITVLPLDKEYEGEIKASDTGNISLSLGAEQTSQLLQEVPKAYHTEINDILLSALAKTLCDWSGGDNVVIGMEGHGREQIEDGIDTSRTTGWFTSHYPVLFELNSVKGEGDFIKSVKEQLRRVPDKGLGYGVLKYINKDEKLLNSESPDIIFNYLGQSDNILSGSKWFSMADEPAGMAISEDYIFSNKLSVNAIVQKGEMVLHWTYSKKHYEKQTIDKIVQNYKSNLELLIANCLIQEKSGMVYTPSDFGLGSEISYAELDRFLTESYNGKVRRENFESIYRLSGLQQGILFHGLYDGGEETYIRQLSCNFLKVDTDVFHKSWALVMSGTVRFAALIMLILSIYPSNVSIRLQS